VNTCGKIIHSSANGGTYYIDFSGYRIGPLACTAAKAEATLKYSQGRSPAAAPTGHEAPRPKFALGGQVRKIKGSSWSGTVAGAYSTAPTPEGYAVESFTEHGSVQVYPASALEAIDLPALPFRPVGAPDGPL
jgi:R67 dihydrofolate reductase